MSESARKRPIFVFVPLAGAPYAVRPPRKGEWRFDLQRMIPKPWYRTGDLTADVVALRQWATYSHTATLTREAHWVHFEDCTVEQTTQPSGRRIYRVTERSR